MPEEIFLDELYEPQSNYSESEQEDRLEMIACERREEEDSEQTSVNIFCIMEYIKAHGLTGTELRQLINCLEANISN